MKKAFSFVIILIAVTALWGCQKKPAAVVNGEPITEEDLQKKLQENISRHGAEGAKVDSAALRKAVLNQMISETLLLQGALEANISVSDEDVRNSLQAIRARSGEEAFKRDLANIGLSEKEFVKLLRERMLKERFVQSIMDDNPITDEQLKEFYKNSPKPFIRPAESNIRFIEFTNQAKADEVMQRIKDKKESFDAIGDRLQKSDEAVVSEYSWITPTAFSATIRDALTNMKEGSVAGPFTSNGSIYIFRLKARRPEGVKSFEEAKEDIRRILREEKKASVILHWVAKKRKESIIAIN